MDNIDNFLFDDSMIFISDGRIEAITSERNTTFVTVTYTVRANRSRQKQSIRLAVNRNTLILDEFGNRIPASELTTGMIINAVISSAFTRSIPPQSSASLIKVVRRPANDNTTVGRIIDMDREHRMITTISGNDPSSIIRFNVPTNARILNVSGQPISFFRLIPGLRVRIRHAAFMTASIPPQTTAFEIRVMQ